MDMCSKRIAGLILVASWFALAPAVAGVGTQGTYSDWIFPDMPAGGFQEIEDMIYPANDPAAKPGQVAQAYFYSSQFGIVSGDGGYIGIQTDTGNSPAPKKAIFSIWGANAARCSTVEGALCQPFTGEGDGYQTLIPYEWVAGHQYRTRVRALDSDAGGDWWVGEITDETTGDTQIVGYIRVPSVYEGLSYYVINWVEWYAPQAETCDQLPSSTVYFSPARANGGAYVAGAPNNHLGGGACPSEVEMAGDWVSHHNGRPAWTRLALPAALEPYYASAKACKTSVESSPYGPLWAVQLQVQRKRTDLDQYIRAQTIRHPSGQRFDRAENNDWAIYDVIGGVGTFASQLADDRVEFGASDDVASRHVVIGDAPSRPGDLATCE